MLEDAVHTAIRTPIMTAWTASYPDFPVIIDGQELESDNVNITAYIRISFTNADSQNISLGNKHIRTIAVLQIQIFRFKGLGDKLSRDLGVFLQDTIRGMAVTDVTFRASTLRRAGSEGRWFQMNLDVPYWLEHHYP